MRSSRKILIAIVFAVIFAAVLGLLDLALYPCTFVRNDIHAVATEANDVLILGTSNAKMGIDPDVMLEGTGMTGHNAANGSQYMVDSYYIAKLAIRNHKPKCIMLEIDPGYFTTEKEKGNNYLLYYHEFPMSLSKLEYFGAINLDSDFKAWLFPEYEYSLSYELNHMGETFSRKLHKDYSADSFRTEAQEYRENGFIYRNPVSEENFPGWNPEIFDEAEVKAVNLEYLEKLKALCDENEIALVAVYMPLPIRSLATLQEEYKASFAYFQNCFDEKGIPFYNFNTNYFKAYSHDMELFCDYDGHMNGDAARDFSRVLGQIVFTPREGR